MRLCFIISIKEERVCGRGVLISAIAIPGIGIVLPLMKHSDVSIVIFSGKLLLTKQILLYLTFNLLFIVAGSISNGFSSSDIIASEKAGRLGSNFQRFLVVLFLLFLCLISKYESLVAV